MARLLENFHSSAKATHEFQKEVLARTPKDQPIQLAPKILQKNFQMENAEVTARKSLEAEVDRLAGFPG